MRRPAGRLVVAGSLRGGLAVGSDGFVAQLLADTAALDPGYGLGFGWSRINLGPDDGVNDVALRPDGRIVVAGWTGGDGLVSRLLAVEGTFDPSFGGGDGVATAPFGADDSLSGIVLQQDGRVLVSGYRYEASLSSDGLFARLLENEGTFDPAFADGTGGFSEDFGSRSMSVEDIVLQPDGRIVYGGAIETAGNTDILIGRLLNPQADDDPSFGGGTGRTVIDAGGFDYVSSIAIQPDGKIVAAGARARTPGAAGDDFAVVRLLPDGLPDPSFSGDGLVTIRIGSDADASSVVLQPNGKILVAGGSRGPAGNDDMAVARLRPDGSPDPTFGTGGTVTVDLGGFEDARSVALRPDGRIVLAGTTKPASNGSQDIAVARLLGGDPPEPGPGDPSGPGGAAGTTASCAGRPATIV
ncbi:MAG: hypothetical protein U0237_20810, partial [Thermoleophilia bacterium]